MTRHGVFVLGALCALASAGCVRRYEEPAITEPHATVKIRVLHHERSGPQLALTGRLAPAGDEYGIDLLDGSLRVVRVRLLPTRYRVSSSFFHTTMELQTVFETERYACGTTHSGYGTHTYSQTQYCSRSVPRQRWVSVRVSDGDCSAVAFQATPVEGAVYLVQYDYFGDGVCSMTCLRQIDTGGGTFRFVACGIGEPPTEATSGGETGLAMTILPAPSSEVPFVAPAPAPETPFVPPAPAAPSSDAPFVPPTGARALAPPTR